MQRIVFICTFLFLLTACSSKTSPFFMNENYQWKGESIDNRASGKGTASEIIVKRIKELRYCGNTINGKPNGLGNWYDSYLTHGIWNDSICSNPSYFLREVKIYENGTFTFIDGGRILGLRSKSSPTYYPFYYLAQADSLEETSIVDSIYENVTGKINTDTSSVHYFFSGESSKSSLFNKSTFYNYFYIEIDNRIQYRILSSINYNSYDARVSWEIIYQYNQQNADLKKYTSFEELKKKLKLY